MVRVRNEVVAGSEAKLAMFLIVPQLPLVLAQVRPANEPEPPPNEYSRPLVPL